MDPIKGFNISWMSSPNLSVTETRRPAKSGAKMSFMTLVVLIPKDGWKEIPPGENPPAFDVFLKTLMGVS